MIKSRMFFVVILFITMSCAPKGYRTYIAEESLPVRKERKEIKNIEFYFSSLDSIKPYIHQFSSGAISVPSPNLDPREFMLPKELTNYYRELTSNNQVNIELISIPEREFIILGEVMVILPSPPPALPTYNFLNHLSQNMPEAPNLKPYVNLPGISWKPIFKKLKKNAGKIGADAIIEIYCGKGINSFWSPPSNITTSGTSIPTYGTNGQIIGSYTPPITYTTPGGIETTNWQLMGLAIKWK